MKITRMGGGLIAIEASDEEKSVEQQEQKTDPYDICPICKEKYVTRCRCFLADSTCKNGHHWHMCMVHRTTVIGESDHAHGGRCSCGKGENGVR